MRRSVSFGRLYVCWGKLPNHSHFKNPEMPPTRWQLIRADTWKSKRPLIWLLWLYPSDGTAIFIEFGMSSRTAKAAAL